MFLIQAPATAQEQAPEVENSFVEDSGFDDDEDNFIDVEETTETVEDKDSLFVQFAASKNWAGCATTRGNNTYYNYLGMRIFGYFQEISHCWQRNGTVTSARLVNRWAELYNVPLVKLQWSCRPMEKREHFLDTRELLCLLGLEWIWLLQELHAYCEDDTNWLREGRPSISSNWFTCGCRSS